MKVLLVGGGGREAALAWALARSPEVTTLRCAPGNAGIGSETVSISADDVDGLVDHAVAERYDLVVVGPEGPLVAGLVDRLAARGIPAFGPSAAAARLEGSKVFAKEFMARHGIPTARFRVFDDPGEAARHLGSDATEFPLVVKADGLAAGKGVVVAEDRETATETAAAMLSGRSFGDAGRRIVVEEMLRGREVSFFCLCDGERYLELAPCQDYKRVGDADTGPNTGGMGTYSPSAHLKDADRAFLRERVVAPLLRGMAAEGNPFRGVLFVGVMLTVDGPKVLEFNARFGDPETQVLLPRLEGDWLPLLRAAAAGDLRGLGARFTSDAAVCVVMAAGGYPGGYAKGTPIEGVERARALARVEVFTAGTAVDASGRLVTNGGRVLGVTGFGPDVETARRRAYEGVASIRWEGEHHRSDIAADAVGR